MSTSKALGAAASELIRRAAEAGAGTYIRNPVWNRFNGQQLFTGHPLGGCIMGDDAGTAVGVVLAGKARAQIGAGRQFEDLCARVEQHDIFERHAGTLGDTVHLFDIGQLERLDDRQIVAHQRGNTGTVERELL